MANELRSRTAFVGGLVEDNPLTSGATTLTSAGLAALATIDSTNHAAIILDPDGIGGAPEIVYVTTHTAAAATATIARGKESSTARQHAQDTPWIHSATLKEFDGSGGGSGLIGLTAYAPGTNTNILAGTATSITAVDATNLTVTFTAPPSGKVVVELEALMGMTSTANGYWGLLDGANAQVGKTNYMTGLGGTSNRLKASIVVTGLTAGTSYTYKWAYLTNTSTFNIYGGPAYGDAIMRVWAVNV